MRICILALSICAVGLSTSAFAKIKPVSLRDQQQAACYDDVMTLCKDAVPDEAKVTTCMESKKSMVSAKMRRHVRCAVIVRQGRALPS